MRKDDKDIFACLDTSNKVNEGVCNVGVVHVQISTQYTPKDTFERRHTRAFDSTCYESINGIRKLGPDSRQYEN